MHAIFIAILRHNSPSTLEEFGVQANNYRSNTHNIALTQECQSINLKAYNYNTGFV